METKERIEATHFMEVIKWCDGEVSAWPTKTRYGPYYVFPIIDLKFQLWVTKDAPDSTETIAIFKIKFKLGCQPC